MSLTSVRVTEVVAAVIEKRTKVPVAEGTPMFDLAELLHVDGSTAASIYNMLVDVATETLLEAAS